MRYALLVYNDDGSDTSPDEQSGRVETYAAFADTMRARGVLHDAGLRLRPTTTATTVRVRDGDVVIADGPFAETKEQIGGFFVVDCHDLDEAIEVASQIPGALYGSIEVRPVWEM